MSSPVDPIVDILEAGAWTKVEFYLGRAVLLRPPAYLEEELALTGATPQLPRDAVFQKTTEYDPEAQRSLATLLQAVRDTGYGELEPVDVLGDGYCLFHAVSNALYGNTLHWALIRAKVRAELQEHRLYYTEHAAASERDVDDAIRDLCTEGAFNDNGAWSTEFCVQAMSNMLRRPVCLFVEERPGTTSKLYLPVRHASPEAIATCCRTALCLAWQNASCTHYVPLCRTRHGTMPRIPAGFVPSQDEILLMTMGQRVGDIDKYVDMNEDGSLNACACNDGDANPYRQMADTLSVSFGLIETLDQCAVREIEELLAAEQQAGGTTTSSPLKVALDALGECSEYKSDIPSLRATDTLIKVTTPLSGLRMAFGENSTSEAMQVAMKELSKYKDIWTTVFCMHSQRIFQDKLRQEMLMGLVPKSLLRKAISLISARVLCSVQDLLKEVKLSASLHVRCASVLLRRMENDVHTELMAIVSYIDAERGSEAVKLVTRYYDHSLRWSKAYLFEADQMSRDRPPPPRVCMNCNNPLCPGKKAKIEIPVEKPDAENDVVVMGSVLLKFQIPFDWHGGDLSVTVLREKIVLGISYDPNICGKFMEYIHKIRIPRTVVSFLHSNGMSIEQIREAFGEEPITLEQMNHEGYFLFVLDVSEKISLRKAAVAELEAKTEREKKARQHNEAVFAVEANLLGVSPGEVDACMSYTHIIERTRVIISHCKDYLKETEAKWRTKVILTESEAKLHRSGSTVGRYFKKLTSRDSTDVTRAVSNSLPPRSITSPAVLPSVDRSLSYDSDHKLISKEQEELVCRVVSLKKPTLKRFSSDGDSPNETKDAYNWLNRQAYGGGSIAITTPSLEAVGEDDEEAILAAAIALSLQPLNDSV